MLAEQSIAWAHVEILVIDPAIEIKSHAVNVDVLVARS